MFVLMDAERGDLGGLTNDTDLCSMYPEGEVTTFMDYDLQALHEGMVAPPETVTRAGLHPNVDQIVQFAASWNKLHGTMPSLGRLISNFTEASRIDGDYFMCNVKEAIEIAEAIETIDNLSLEQRWMLCAAPVRMRERDVRTYFLRFVSAIASNTPCRMDIQLPIAPSTWTPAALSTIEYRLMSIDIYCWLAQRTPLLFPDLEAAERLREAAIQQIEAGLMSMSSQASETRLRAVRWRKHSLAQQGGGGSPGLSAGSSALRASVGDDDNEDDDVEGGRGPASPAADETSTTRRGAESRRMDPRAGTTYRPRGGASDFESQADLDTGSPRRRIATRSRGEDASVL